jgi:transcriptional regulator with XRE-family HTH domain
MTKKKPSPRDQEIGRRIRTQRLALGISQAALGEKLGITFQQIQKYEKGVNRIGSGRLEELSRILGVPVGFFFDDDRNTADVRHALDLADTGQALRLLKAFSEIKAPDIRRVLVDLAVHIAAREQKG